MTRPRGAARLLAAFAACFLVACGIEYYVYLYPVISINNNPTNTETSGDNYYGFKTRDEDNIDDADDYFLGFEIYYRIFYSVSDASSDETSVANKNTNDPSNVGTYLQETLKYQRLRASILQEQLPLIPRGSLNRDVNIRLWDEGLYMAGFEINGIPQASWGVPYRSTGSSSVLKNSFDFDEIQEGDIDVDYNTPTDATKRYVNAFVVTIGMDENYRRLYSEAKFLGRVTIEDDD